MRGQLCGIGSVMLVVLITGTFALDFLHGVRLGEDHVAYSPIYRLRQSLAIGISRLHDPPAGRYLAYKSVVDALAQGGFAMFDTDPGQRLDAAGQTAFLNDGARLDQAIRRALDVTVNRNLAPQIIQGNELGLADYIDVSFRLFGARIASLYYLFFLIVALTSLIYVWQFRNSPFLLFVLVVFLGELWFLENMAHDWGIEMNTVDNSRLFSGLSLVPALHVLFILWQRRRPDLPTIAAVLAQSVIFAFLLSCRTEVAWQLAMIVAAASGIGIWLMWRPEAGGRGALRRLAPLWPAAAFVVIASAYSGTISLRADARYAREPEAHVLWHEVLRGIFVGSPRLTLEYLGDHPDPNRDNQIYDAVIRDLNVRGDASSPIAYRTADGRLTINPMLGWAEYDRLVRSLTMRIIVQHPLAVLSGIPVKLGWQAARFRPGSRAGMAWAHFRIPLILIAAGALACWAAGGLELKPDTLNAGAAVGTIVLAFAALTPVMVEPSDLAIGTLFAYFGALALMACIAVALLLQAVTGYEPGGRPAAMDVEPAR